MISPNSRLRVIVLGYLVRGPLGGMVWSNLQFLRGLRLLGHDVYFLEDSDDYPSCYDPNREVTDTNPSYGLEFATRVLEDIDFGQRWAYYDAHKQQWSGPCSDRIDDICSSADLLLNLCGVNPLRPWLMQIPHRALVDEDPAFTQIRHLTDSDLREAAARHTVFFSFGENIALGTSRVPADSFSWQATRQPVVFDKLSPIPAAGHGGFTTVMQWQSYASRDYLGVRYGMKGEAFEPYFDLPKHAGAELELAVANAQAPREKLATYGWKLRDPFEVTRDPSTYEDYLKRSKAEFSVAKLGYVTSRSGWFSERSVAYLSLGRPVVVQQTGFTDWLPADGGVVPFASFEEAVSAIDDVNRRYAFHCRAAREVVEQFFAARKVLPWLLERAMNPDLSVLADARE